MNQNDSIAQLTEEVGYWKTRCRLLEKREKAHLEQIDILREYVVYVGTGYHEGEKMFIVGDKRGSSTSVYCTPAQEFVHKLMSKASEDALTNFYKVEVPEAKP